MVAAPAVSDNRGVLPVPGVPVPRVFRVRTLVLVVLIGALSASCSDPSGGCGAGDPSSAAGAPAAQIGTAPAGQLSAWSPLGDGQRVPLATLGQGGFHVWLQVAARSFCFDGLRVTRRATLIDAPGQPSLAAHDLPRFVAAGDPVLASGGWRLFDSAETLFLCPTPHADVVADRRVRVEIELVDTRGQTARDARTIVPYCPPELARCPSLCAPTDLPDAGPDGETDGGPGPGADGGPDGGSR